MLTSLAACPSDDTECGPGDAPDDGLVATGLGVELTFSGLTAGANNDCPIDGTPEGVISMTIGTQFGAPNLFTLCVPRPDQLGGGEVLGIDDPASEDPAVRVVDIEGTDVGCTYELDDTVAPTGTARAEGLCDDTGAAVGGFALVVDGDVTLTRTCDANVDTVVVTLAGRIAVQPDS